MRRRRCLHAIAVVAVVLCSAALVLSDSEDESDYDDEDHDLTQLQRVFLGYEELRRAGWRTGGQGARRRHAFVLAVELWGVLLCAASVIGSHWALSAAHCLHGLRAHAPLHLRGGSVRWGRGGQLFPVAHVLRHEEFDISSLRHDICLVRSAVPLAVAGLPLPALPLSPPTLALPPGAIMTLVGWGAVSDPRARELQEAYLPLVSRSWCAKEFGEEEQTHAVCCGHVPGVGAEACHADSGGPLLLGLRLYGFASFGAGCARNGRPGLFTRVAAYRLWIKQRCGI